MTSDNKRVIKKLFRLYRLCKAGERGFETVAENVSNRGLKVLLKNHAQQRRQFAAELSKEIDNLGGTVSNRRSVRGAIHRGRINIMATMTIGPENVEKAVLKEAVLGEKAATTAYRKALDSDLPAEIKDMIKRQYEQIQEVSGQIDQLLGRTGKHIVVRLFDLEADVETAVQALQGEGISTDILETQTLNEVMNVYEGKGGKLTETVASGAVGGAIWSSILGTIAGLVVVLIPGMQPFGSMGAQGTWAILTLSIIVAGAVFGAFFGFLIGVGVLGEDTYLYEQSMEHGQKLVLLQTDHSRAAEASKIMHQVNAQSRQERGIGLPEYK
jgi:uncharacterized protein (TIGR02284 family)